MQDPHLERTRGPGRQTDLLYSFQSWPGRFLDLLILDRNTTKPFKNKKTIKQNHTTKKKKHTNQTDKLNESRSLRMLWSTSREDAQSVTSLPLELPGLRGAAENLAIPRFWPPKASLTQNWNQTFKHILSMCSVSTYTAKQAPVTASECAEGWEVAVNI